MNPLAHRDNAWLALPVLAVELATLTNLAGYYRYHEIIPAALLLALSFSVLLIASAILLSQDISTHIRALLLLGGTLLFLIQGASNVSEAFLHAQAGGLPAERLTALWGGSPERLTVASAFFWGGIINVVGLIYWVAFGWYLGQQQRQQARAQADLQAFLSERR